MHYVIVLFSCISKFDIEVHASYHASWHLLFSNLHLGIWFKGLVHDFSFEMVFLGRTGLTGFGHRSDRLVQTKLCTMSPNNLLSAISSMIWILVAVKIIFM
jgi:hypothetical protein